MEALCCILCQTSKFIERLVIRLSSVLDSPKVHVCMLALNLAQNIKDVVEIKIILMDKLGYCKMTDFRTFI